MLTANLEEVPPVAVVTELVQRERVVILSAVSVAVKAAGHPFVTLADMLNLDATQNHLSEVSETRERMKQKNPVCYSLTASAV